MNPMVRTDDGCNYYTYVLIYVDDVIVMHHDEESFIRRIDRYFKLNPSLIGDSDIYLGANLKKTILENGV